MVAIASTMVQGTVEMVRRNTFSLLLDDRVRLKYTTHRLQIDLDKVNNFKWLLDRLRRRAGNNMDIKKVNMNIVKIRLSGSKAPLINIGVTGGASLVGISPWNIHVAERLLAGLADIVGGDRVRYDNVYLGVYNMSDTDEISYMIQDCLYMALCDGPVAKLLEGASIARVRYGSVVVKRDGLTIVVWGRGSLMLYASGRGPGEIIGNMAPILELVERYADE